MREWIRRRMPTEEGLRQTRGLRWLAPLLGRPGLWHLNRRRVALGAAIGVFCGLLIPLAQIAGAAVLALLLRANLPVAALATFITNPVTIGPIFVLAYRTGAAVLGEQAEPAAAQALERSTQEAEPVSEGGRPRWIEQARAIGKPLFLGLVIFAVGGGVLTWLAVYLVWTLGVRLKRRRLLSQRGDAVRAPPGDRPGPPGPLQP
jgi:uncharacterized protein (DUF2062 family)